MPKGIPQKKYSVEFKIRVVGAIRTEHLDCPEAAECFGVQNKTQVARWERIYLEEGKEALLVERRGWACAALFQPENYDRCLEVTDVLSQMLFPRSWAFRCKLMLAGSAEILLIPIGIFAVTIKGMIVVAFRTLNVIWFHHENPLSFWEICVLWWNHYTRRSEWFSTFILVYNTILL